MYISDYIRLKAMKSVLDADLLPLFSGHTTLLEAKDELDRIIGQLEDRFKKEGKTHFSTITALCSLGPSPLGAAPAPQG